MKYDTLDYLSCGEMQLLESTSNGVETIHFFIKDTDKALSLIGSNPVFETKAICFEVNKTISMLVMFRMNRNDSLIYSEWFEFNNLFDRKLVDRLLFQKDVKFCVINKQNESVHQFDGINRIKDIIKNYKKHKVKINLDEELFKKMLTNINKYPDKLQLFNKISYAE